MSIFTPTNQVRLTNVSVVRYKTKGKRFEVACFRGKVTDWRNKVEKDIDEVLQSKSVFTNVSKGQNANKKDLLEVFGTDDEEAVCKLILDWGELQVTEKERKADMEAKFRDIATIVADKCINSETQRPFPVTLIESSMRDMHYSVKTGRTAKQQALVVIRLLRDKLKLPIQRAQMRIRIGVPKKVAKAVKKAVEPLLAAIEAEEWPGDYELVALIDPGAYRELDERIKEQTKGQGTLNIVDMKVTDLGEFSLDEKEAEVEAGLGGGAGTEPLLEEKKADKRGGDSSDGTGEADAPAAEAPADAKEKQEAAGTGAEDALARPAAKKKAEGKAKAPAKKKKAKRMVPMPDFDD